MPPCYTSFLLGNEPGGACRARFLIKQSTIVVLYQINRLAAFKTPTQFGPLGCYSFGYLDSPPSSTTGGFDCPRFSMFTAQAVTRPTAEADCLVCELPLRSHSSPLYQRCPKAAGGVRALRPPRLSGTRVGRVCSRRTRVRREWCRPLPPALLWSCSCRISPLRRPRPRPACR